MEDKSNLLRKVEKVKYLHLQGQENDPKANSNGEKVFSQFVDLRSRGKIIHDKSVNAKPAKYSKNIADSRAEDVNQSPQNSNR